MLVGNLVYLRSMEMEDMDQVRKWNFDPQIRPSLNTSLPVSRIQQKLWFERLQTDRTKHKLVIVDRTTGRDIGIMSAMKIDHEHKNCEVGWTIGEKEFWGKGHAIDAAFTFLSFLFDQFGLHMVYAYVLSSNARALSFFVNKIGFAETGRYKEARFKDGVYIDNVLLCLRKEDMVKTMNQRGYTLRP